MLRKQASLIRTRFTEVCTIFIALIVLLPNTLVTSVIDNLWLSFADGIGLTDIAGNFNAFKAAYLVGYVALIMNLAEYLLVRRYFFSSVYQTRLADIVAALSCVYLLDCYISTDKPFSYEHKIWPFIVMCSFWAIVLNGRKFSYRLLIYYLVCVVSIQSLLAIFCYASGLHQFQSPFIGGRTCGTFDNPLQLYPLCLMTTALCFGLQYEKNNWIARFLLNQAAMINILALVLTFTRAAWIAEAVSVMYMLRVTRKNFYIWSPPYRLFIFLLASCLLLGALQIRSGGFIAGNVHDRSVRGRLQIWAVATRIISQRPIIGTGLATYSADQDNNMTDALRSYRPTNQEAKSLYLNFAVEFGLVSVVFLGMFFALSLRLCKVLMGMNIHEKLTLGISAGVSASVLGVIVAGIADCPILEQTKFSASYLFFLLMAIISIVPCSPQEER